MKDIIFMQPVYKDYIWGGTKIKDLFQKNTPYDITAESWEISSNKSGNCKILNEKFKNMNLKDLFDDMSLRKEIFGTNCINMSEFPLIIKFIDAKQNLSIQVHPDDDYAKSKGFSSGKTEMWYIVDCDKETKIIAGLNRILNREELSNYIQDNKLTEIIKYHDIEKGDSLLITPGTLHAIMAGTFICEIQQNCDITYRVFDWNRVGNDGKKRKLHIEDALNVINTKSNIQVKKNSVDEIINLSNNKYFKVDKITCNSIFKDETNGESFFSLTVVEGKGKILVNDIEYFIKAGDSFIIPATKNKYILEGELKILKSYINKV